MKLAHGWESWKVGHRDRVYLKRDRAAGVVRVRRSDGERGEIPEAQFAAAMSFCADRASCCVCGAGKIGSISFILITDPCLICEACRAIHVVRNGVLCLAEEAGE